MNIEQLHEFVVFSRYLNFSKAALMLNMAQPTLSNHISAMEKELGFELVKRSKQLRLSPAGKRFCVYAEKLLGEYRSVISTCKDIATKDAGALTVERPVHQSGIKEEFDHLLLAFQKQHAIVVEKQATRNMAFWDLLETGTADLVFVINAGIALYDSERAAQVEILPAPKHDRGLYHLWVDEAHPLSKKKDILLEDIAGCTFLIPSSVRYQYFDDLTKYCSAAIGAPVGCSRWPGSYEECITNIQPDEVMFISAADLENPAYSMVPRRTLVPLLDSERLVSPAFVYRKDNDNPALRLFADFIREESEKAQANKQAKE